MKLNSNAQKREQYIVIIGCGRLGSHLASDLSESKYNSVVIIDSKEAAFDRLGSTFNGFTLYGDALEMDVLEKAKMKDADIVIVTTQHDNSNLMIAQIAKLIFNVPKVIARLINPSQEKIYQELGIATVSPTDLTANACLQFIEHKESEVSA